MMKSIAVTETKNEKRVRIFIKCGSVFACFIGFFFMIGIFGIFIFAISNAFTDSGNTPTQMARQTDAIINPETATPTGGDFVAGIFVGVIVAIIYGLAMAFTCAISVASEIFEHRIVDYLVGRNRQSSRYQDVNSNVQILHRYKLLKITEILFSANTQRDVFLPIMADWDEEIFNNIKTGKNNKFMITIRNLYAFLAAIWKKSLLGDLIKLVIKIVKSLIEFVIKITKQ